MVHPYYSAQQQKPSTSHPHRIPSHLGNNTRTSSSPLQYLENVLSRFGHHLSAQQRSDLSQSMVPALQRSSPPGMSPPSPSSSSHITSSLDGSITAWVMRKGNNSNKKILAKAAAPLTTTIDLQQELPATVKIDSGPATVKEDGDGEENEQMDVDQDQCPHTLPQKSME